MEQGHSKRGHQTRVRRKPATGSPAFTAMLVSIGVLLGAAQMGLGAHLASGNIGWSASLIFSVVGLVGGTAGMYGWSSRRSRACYAVAGIAVGLGAFASMGLLLDFSQPDSGMVHAWTQEPIGVLAWLGLWVSWILIALVRLFFFEAPKTRHRLSSRRGDQGQ